MTKLVSIVMPAYNAGKYIAEAIASVRGQSYPHWELIVVDDESEDDTAAIVKNIQQNDSRVKYYWQRNGKQGKTRNYGIRESSGEYLAFMDADDVWMSDKLSLQVAELEKGRADVVFGYAYLIENELPTTKTTGRGKGFYQGQPAVDFFLYHDALVISTVLMTKLAAEKVGGFVEDRDIQYCEDWHFWLKLAFENFSFFSEGRVVSYYRHHEDSAARSERNEKVKFFLALYNLSLRYPERSELKSEVIRRAHALVFHSESLDIQVVRKIADATNDNESGSIWRNFYLPVRFISMRVFRKLFLYSVRKNASLK